MKATTVIVRGRIIAVEETDVPENTVMLRLNQLSDARLKALAEITKDGRVGVKLRD